MSPNTGEINPMQNGEISDTSGVLYQFNMVTLNRQYRLQPEADGE